jgi:hypothetical protein
LTIVRRRLEVMFRSNPRSKPNSRLLPVVLDVENTATSLANVDDLRRLDTKITEIFAPVAFRLLIITMDRTTSTIAMISAVIKGIKSNTYSMAAIEIMTTVSIMIVGVANGSV